MLKNTQTRAFHVMAKPSGSVCNLNCSYCFYLEKEVYYQQHNIMSDNVLETYVRSYIESTYPEDEVAFTWQGGEPALAGLEFYQKAVSLQDKYGAGRKISNSFQTNGILLNDAWCQFFSDNDFLIGLSLEGPAAIHDKYRLTKSGKPTHHRVMRALALLQKHKVKYNVLTCVNRHSAQYPLEIYHFLRDAGVEFIQFIPVVERLADDDALQAGLKLHAPGGDGSRVTPWTVLPADYGHFLISVFEEWRKRDVGSIFVMNIEWAFARFINAPGAVCHHQPTCGRSVIVEHNGDIYACDHYVYPQHRLGNIMGATLAEMIDSAGQVKFGTDKYHSLPRQCRQCRVLQACQGGCPKHRFMRSKEGEPGLNYLCDGFQLYFNHLPRWLKAMTDLIASGRPASDIMIAQQIHTNKSSHQYK